MVRIAPAKTYTFWHKEEDAALIEMLKLGLNRLAIARILRKTVSAINARREKLLGKYLCTKSYMMRARNPHKLPTNGTRKDYTESLVIGQEIAHRCGVR